MSNFPDNWQIQPLEECMSAIIDYRGKSPNKKTSGIPLITAKVVKAGRIEKTEEFIAEDEYEEWMQRGLPEPGDVVMTTEAPLGEIAQLDGQKVALAQRLITLRGKPQFLDNTYLKFLMQGAFVQDELKARATGTTVVGIRQSELRKVPLVIPPLPEQRAIASVLGALDDKIELNRRMNETLEALAQSLFKSWFVDATQSALPKGWREGTLNEITGFLGGYAFKSKDWIEQGVPVVKIGSVKPGIVDLNQVSFVSEEVAAEAKRYRLCAGDLLIGMTGYVGEAGLVPPSDNLPLLNQRVGKFVLEKPGTTALGFLYCLTRRPEFKAGVETKSHGTAQANVSADGILSVPVTVPPQTLMDTFNAFCEPILNRILANHAESRTLAALRDALLPKLLSGELRVPAANKLMEASA